MTDAERLLALENTLRDLIIYMTDGQPHRALRSLVSPTEGAALFEFVEAVRAEREEASNA